MLCNVMYGMYVCKIRMHVCMSVCLSACLPHGWMDGCVDVWMYGCMDVWMHGCMHACMYRVQSLPFKLPLLIEFPTCSNVMGIMKSRNSV